MVGFGVSIERKDFEWGGEMFAAVQDGEFISMPIEFWDQVWSVATAWRENGEQA